MNLSTNPLFTHGIEKLCSICHVVLRNTDCSQSIFSTLEEFESAMNVLQVLQSFSNFNFYNGAQRLCTTCYSKTIEVYKFIQICNKPHDNMQHYLKNVGDETDVDVTIEEISIAPTRIIIDGREFLEETENETISKIDDMEMVLSGTEIKMEERILEDGMEKEEIKTITDQTGFNVKVEEMSIAPTRIINDGRGFLEEMENNTISKIDEMEMVIAGTEIKIEERILQGMEKEGTSSNEEITISHTEIVTEENRNGRHFNNVTVEKIDSHMHYERLDSIKCKDCHLVFSDKKDLADHRKEAKHSKEKSFLNELCNSFIGTKYNLRSHDAKRGHVSEDLRLNQDRHQPLRDHEQTHNHVHTGENSFTCDFAAQSSLRGDIYNVVDAHKCEQCDRRFTRAAHLRRHMDMHNGVKAHKCEQCDRRFTQASNLRRHMDIHNGVKAHKCEQCCRRFALAQNLHTHVHIHNGVKPHKCEQCDRRFIQSSTLRKHMKTHNGVESTNAKSAICDSPTQ